MAAPAGGAGADADAPPSLRLDDALKFFGVASTGGHAKLLIQRGDVRVNGVVETRRKHRLVEGDRVRVAGEEFVIGFEPTVEQ
ncbi:MAG: RNA-binding S4 domain-containing protein [Trueperaceae bacterium]|nr:RNA-binding S4 domain-containing protein [Trueperaceae bacterium]